MFKRDHLFNPQTKVGWRGNYYTKTTNVYWQVFKWIKKKCNWDQFSFLSFHLFSILDTNYVPLRVVSPSWDLYCKQFFFSYCQYSKGLVLYVNPLSIWVYEWHAAGSPTTANMNKHLILAWCLGAYFPSSNRHDTLHVLLNWVTFNYSSSALSAFWTTPQHCLSSTASPPLSTSLQHKTFFGQIWNIFWFLFRLWMKIFSSISHEYDGNGYYLICSNNIFELPLFIEL